LPLLESEVEIDAEFTRDELLFRRVQESELTGGELDPSRLNSISFSKEIEGAPSFLRSKFSTPYDTIHCDCCDGKDRSDWLVYYLSVEKIPGPLHSGDNRSFVFQPVHKPLPLCGAHSVLGCLEAGDTSGKYMVPSRKVLNDLRTKLATTLLPIRQIFNIETRLPL
jgi:hypothetical protein